MIPWLVITGAAYESYVLRASPHTNVCRHLTGPYICLLGCFSVGPSWVYYIGLLRLFDFWFPFINWYRVFEFCTLFPPLFVVSRGHILEASVIRPIDKRAAYGSFPLIDSCMYLYIALHTFSIVGKRLVWISVCSGFCSLCDYSFNRIVGLWMCDTLPSFIILCLMATRWLHQ